MVIIIKKNRLGRGGFNVVEKICIKVKEKELVRKLGIFGLHLRWDLEGCRCPECCTTHCTVTLFFPFYLLFK